MDARVGSRVSDGIKEKASKELAAHGLSSAANDGLSKVPNAESMSSINEAADDLGTHKLKSASSYNELEKLLDE